MLVDEQNVWELNTQLCVGRTVNACIVFNLVGEMFCLVVLRKRKRLKSKLKKSAVKVVSVFKSILSEYGSYNVITSFRTKDGLNKD